MGKEGVCFLHRSHAKDNESSGNTLREGALRLRELPLGKNKVFSHILRKSCGDNWLLDRAKLSGIIIVLISISQH
ncbi:hypothetical protein H1Q63_21965 [Desmonostoc muscorum CCALA 125]|nr:hypothetical protein [Desmonostoc muscorum CCALA 125]